MTQEELDIALEELEVRLERLRALYEQYFLGFEKVEPAVARKDVDRRIYVLRREKIRNTGKRFKLQTIIQRYNTFQQYWQRICREIENGTYKRHLLRAERQLAPEGQLTIAARRRFGKLIAAGAGEGISNAADAAARPSSAPPRPSSAPPRRATMPPPDSDDAITGRPPAPAVPASVPPFGMQEEAPTQVRRAPPAKPIRTRPLSSQPPEGGAKLDSLELDMGFLGNAPPSPPKPVAAPAARVAAPAVPAAVPAGRPETPAAPAAPRAAPPAKPRIAPPKPRSSPKAAPAPRAERTEGARPDAPLSDDRVRDLHQKLVALKRENKEAGQVSLENLSRSLRETETKLRAQHQGRKIDFDVVIRDGKAIVKPTVR